MGGILLDPGGNPVLMNKWGLRRATNNLAEIYALFMGLDYIVSLGIQDILVIVD